MKQKLSEEEQQAAHKYFSAACFNQVWDLIDKTDRTEEENRQMILLNQASIWHWSQRADCNDENFSIGYWQLSRIYTLINDADNALKSANLCMQFSNELSEFYLGYAFEAVARAQSLAGNTDKATEALEEAKSLSEKIRDEESKKMLMDDLETIQI